MKCNQKSCDRPAIAIMSWPGREPSGICVAHIGAAKKIAEAMGFYLHIEYIDKDVERILNDQR